MKLYIEPKMNVVYLETTDIITASCDNPNVYAYVLEDGTTIPASSWDQTTRVVGTDWICP